MIAAPSPARARSASGRTLDGPQPNRPSAGRSSAGMVMLIRACLSTVRKELTAGAQPWPRPEARPERARGERDGVLRLGRRDLGRGRGLDGVEALDLFGLARVGPDVAG